MTKKYVIVHIHSKTSFLQSELTERLWKNHFCIELHVPGKIKQETKLKLMRSTGFNQFLTVNRTGILTKSRKANPFINIEIEIL